MRIISGTKRGAILNCPEGGTVRPTADRVREGLFNVLSSGRYGDVLASSVVVDAFAGIGSLGLEAWSRRKVNEVDQRYVFIENNRHALEILNSNIKKLKLDDAAVVINRDVQAQLSWPVGKAGLVFLDPPWIHNDDDPDLALLALDNLIQLDTIEYGALISIEHDYRRPAALPSSCKYLDTRKWGKTACTFACFEG